MNRRTLFKKAAIILAAFGLPLPIADKVDSLVLIPDKILYARTGTTFVSYSMGVDGDAVQAIVIETDASGDVEWVALDGNGITIDWSDSENKPKPQGYFVSLPDTNKCEICEADGGASDSKQSGNTC